MRLAHLFSVNRVWKLTSLLIAVVIWISVNRVLDDGPPSPELGELPGQSRTFVLPITAMTAAADPRGFLVRPNSVQVTLRGPAATIQQLQASDLQAFVNLVDVGEARDLSKRIIVHAPPGLTVVTVAPDQVSVDRAGL
jgi:YbbR domain-containing protein